MLRKFKDRVKLGISPSATVIDWDVTQPFPTAGINELKYDGDKVEPTFNPKDLEEKAMRRNVYSINTNKPLDDHFYLFENGRVSLECFGRIVATETMEGEPVLDPSWDREPETSKQVSAFLGERPYSIKKKIESGTFKLEDLNATRDDV